MAEPQNPLLGTIPGTPGIREARSDLISDSFEFFPAVDRDPPCGESNRPGIRRVNLRAEIDTSPPFESVKEAVTRFGGSGSWLPFYKLGDDAYNEMEEFDIRKVEEKAAELEKDLIVKELETLDVLEELGATKRVVEELKQQLHKEAYKCMTTPELHSDKPMSAPAIKEMNKEEHCEQIVGSSSPCPASSADFILSELKKAKMNLGKTINDLRMIQISVESLNKKMKEEKTLRERLNSKFPGVASSEMEPNHMRPNNANDVQGNGHMKKMVDPIGVVLGTANGRNCMKTVEMRWIAAKKMEEAARAAEALALAELKALSSINGSLPEFSLPEPEQSPQTPRVRNAEELSNEQVVHVIHRLNEANLSKLSILGKLEEATKEVINSKWSLQQALSGVEMAHKKQYAAEEAVRRLMPGHEQRDQDEYNATVRLNNYHRSSQGIQQDLLDDDPQPVLRSQVSMRDVLSRKQQVTPEECVVRRQTEGRVERKRVALSQMLHELREDLTIPPAKTEKPEFVAQRRRFGFIHISLPALQNKKKPQALNTT